LETGQEPSELLVKLHDIPRLAEAKGAFCFCWGEQTPMSYHIKVQHVSLTEVFQEQN
jgi:hypothetical protein